MNYQIFTKFLVVLSFMLIISACQNETNEANPSSSTSPTDTSPTAEATEKETVTLGYRPSLASSSIFVGIEQGYFAEQGIEIEMTVIRSASNILTALNSGELDFAVATMSVPIMNAVGQGINIPFVAGITNDATSFLIVRNALVDSGEVKEIKDLAGRKIGIINTRAFAEYNLDANVLQPNGISVEDVELVSIAVTDMLVALENGAIDAAYLWEPFVTRAVNEDIAVIMDHDYPSVQTLQVQIGNNMLDPAKKETVVRFLTAYLKATRDLEQTGMTEEVAQILSKYSNIPAEVVQTIPLTKLSHNGEIDIADIEAQMQYYLDKGYAEIDEPLTTEQYIDFSFLEEALERVGTL